MSLDAVTESNKTLWAHLPGGAALRVAAAAEAPLRRALVEGHGTLGVPGRCPAGTWDIQPETTGWGGKIWPIQK